MQNVLLKKEFFISIYFEKRKIYALYRKKLLPLLELECETKNIFIY